MPRKKVHGLSVLVISFAVTQMVLAAGASAQTPFAVKLPAGFSEFASQSQSSKAGKGTIETTNWVSKCPTGEAVVVTVSKMSGKILDPAKLMNGTRDSLLRSLKATLESEEQAEGNSTSRLLFNNGSAFLRARVTVVNDTLYQLLYVGHSAEQRSAPHVAALFDSFHVAGGAPQSAALAKQ